MKMRMELVAFAALVSAFSACSRLEPKRDTPQAAVATLVKALERSSPEVTDQVVDPVLLRAEARGAACLSESSKSFECTDALLKCFQGGRLNPACKVKSPEGCPVSVKDCTCGSKGAAAAAAVKQFSSSTYYAALKSFELKTENCKITSSVPVGQGDERQETLGSLDEKYCGEVTDKDELEAVTLACGREQLMFVVRKGSDGWRIAGFPPATDERLSGIGAPADAVVKKREKELNSDMK